MKYFLHILAYLLIITGCSFQPRASSAVTHYYLNPMITLPCVTIKSDKTIRLSLRNTLQWSTSTKIRYVKADLSTGEYLYSQWDQSPNSAIKISLYTYLKENPIFKEVLFQSSSLSSELNLELTLLKFEQHFSSTKDSTATVIMSAVLYDSKSKELISSKIFSANIEANSANAKGGVKALNNALSKVLSDIVCWSVKQTHQKYK